jgi:hypothetical protein
MRSLKRATPICLLIAFLTSCTLAEGSKELSECDRINRRLKVVSEDYAYDAARGLENLAMGGFCMPNIPQKLCLVGSATGPAGRIEKTTSITFADLDGDGDGNCVHRETFIRLTPEARKEWNLKSWLNRFSHCGTRYTKTGEAYSIPFPCKIDGVVHYQPPDNWP